MRVNDLVKFIKERENVRERKEARAHPYTEDPILAKFRFCNVHREDDRVTRWLRQNFYPRFSGEKDLWFAAVVARLFNYPDALIDIQDFILPFKPEKMRKLLHMRRDNGLKNFNAAYIVSTNGVAMDKVDYIVTRVLGPLWTARKELRPLNEMELYQYHMKLTKYDGLGSFIAAQVVADLKYIPSCYLYDANDWMTFAASGPGSRRGLNRVLGFNVHSKLSEGVWRHSLRELQLEVNEELSEPLHAQDLQNCLCEFDKYERARLGEGTPKQLYKEKE